MLAAMLGNGPGHVCTPEAQFVFDLLEPDSPRGRDAIDAIRDHPRWAEWDLDLESDELEDLASAETPAELVRSVVNRWSREHREPAPRVWLDQTPQTIRHPTALAGSFPDAFFIHLVRDGRAVAASRLSLDWGANTAWTAAHAWVRDVADGLAAETVWGPERSIRVRYEEVLSDPEATMRRICREAGLEYTDDMLRSGGFQPADWKGDQHTLVGRAPVASRAEAWKSELSDRQVEVFESVAGSLLESLGYTPEHWPKVADPGPVRILSSLGRQYGLHYLNRLRRALRSHNR